MRDEGAMREKLRADIQRVKAVYEDPLMQMMCLSLIGDEVLVRELEIRGFPEGLLEPLREYLRAPCPDKARLAVWTKAAEAQP